MHKLTKGLKKKKKSKKGKKEAEEEFEPEELERYRRERAERAEQKGGGESSGEATATGNAGSDEWQKFEALTAGVDSILKKTQGDLDRIKSTSFFQRKAALEEPKKPPEEGEEEAGGTQQGQGEEKSKRWVGFDEDGNVASRESGEVGEDSGKSSRSLVDKDGFVEVPDDEDEHEDSTEEDIFDTTYVDVLQNIDVRLAYIPDSPVEEPDDDPFDTTSADKVLRTVDKKGNKLVSLGNAVEILSGRIDHASKCNLPIRTGKKSVVRQDLLLGDFEESEVVVGFEGNAEPIQVEKTLLDDDTDLPDVEVDLTRLTGVLPTPVVPTNAERNGLDAKLDVLGTEEEPNGADSTKRSIDISEFEVLKEKTILEEIPDLDDAEFDLEGSPEGRPRLEEASDPFGSKEPESSDFRTEIIEASFEAATFADEVDPFDTTFADNILPGKAELKFIEKELEELPVSVVSISLTDPAGLNRDYETGLPKQEELQPTQSDGLLSRRPEKDLLSGSTTDLSQLADQPIAPVEEITYVDPFDTSAIKEIPPGKTELKFLERELLGDEETKTGSVLEDNDDDDDDFDPRREDESNVAKPPPARPAAPFTAVEFEIDEESASAGERKASRPDAIDLINPKVISFELPTPSDRPDLLATNEEEKTLPSKPLTPYYSRKSIEDSLSSKDDGLRNGLAAAQEEEEEGEGEEEEEVDPFDTSFVGKVAPGKTELKLIESELLERPSTLPRAIQDDDFDPRAEESVRVNEFVAKRPDILEGNVEARTTQKVYLRQESLLDAEVDVDAKPLTPRIECKTVKEEEGEEEISYVDPFDTSTVSNILPGKAELKVLESELEQITERTHVRTIPIALTTTTIVSIVPEIDDFDPRADDDRTPKDFLCSDEQDSSAKVLTPLRARDGIAFDEDADPFDTSFASSDPGKAELKLLESELMRE